MIEAAAQMYCKPPVAFDVKEWKSKGKTVLEIIIPKSNSKPHKAPTKDNIFKVYVRVKDQNLLANKILLNFWKFQKSQKNIILRYDKAEQFLLNYLRENKSITFSQFYKKTNISRFKAEKILINMLGMNIIEMNLTENKTFYTLKDIPEIENPL